MSSRPFMQLYVSDYLGDTMHLSCEHHGAYMLLLMSMWQAGGTLPNDPRKLARICRVTPAKFKGIAREVLPYFTECGPDIIHNRMQKELKKSQEKSAKRVHAGRKGGIAKALKDKETALANASVLPRHLPDTRYHIETPISPKGEKQKPKRVAVAIPDGFPCQEQIQDGKEYLAGKNASHLLSQIDHIAEQFRLHHESKGSKFKSWPHAWKKWLSNQVQFSARPSYGQPPAQKLSAAEFTKNREAQAARKTQGANT